MTIEAAADDRSVTADPAEDVDEARVEAFAGEVFGFYTGHMLTYLIQIGHRTGLFEAAALGAATSAELADRAGLQERYVREWLGAMVTSGVFDYAPEPATYFLPREHAVCLTGAGASNLAAFAAFTTHLGKHVDGVTRAFREGGGVAYEQFRPEFTDVMDALSRGGFDEDLLSSWLPLAPGVAERLAAGVRVADVGCGTGHAIILLAEAFPSSEFVGYDFSPDAIAAARREAAEVGVDNVTFELCDVAELTAEEPFDVVVVFDAIHDQVAPDKVLANIHDILGPGGVFLMFEPSVSSNLEDNVGHPLAPFIYATSTLHCMTISLAHGGAGLGTAWGEQLATGMLRDAGFVDISVTALPNEPINALFVAHA